MSSLQIGMAVAGGVVLIGVVIHGAWTSRKNKPRQAEPMSGSSMGADAASITPLAASLTHPDESFHDPLTSTVGSPTVTPTSERAAPVMQPPAPTSVHNTTQPSHDPYERQEPTLDPVSDLARSLMAQATEHAQRVPDKQELERLTQARDQKDALRKAQEAAQAAQTAASTASPTAVASEQRVDDDLQTAFMQPEKRPSLDALIDVIAMLELDAPVSGEATLSVYPTTRRVGTKFFAIEGLNADTGLWETPRATQHYSAFQAGVQLANRLGALNEIEFSEFVLKTQTFADALGAAAEFPDMLEQVARARELDHFASAHDAQLSFNLVAVQSAWSPGYVHQNAARLGFIAGAMPGRMVLPGAQNGQPPILVLEFDSQAALADDPAQTAIHHLALSLDVPQVDPAQEPFARMVHAAHELARVMDGAVTDDHGQPLSEAAIGSIARDLQALYATLDTRDLSAGSPQARRLFS